jgi:hypothetical protein
MQNQDQEDQQLPDIFENQLQILLLQNEKYPV